ncbi:MAG: DNA double-strand break repair nuclease NurA [Promethearchaeota archaeon]
MAIKTQQEMEIFSDRKSNMESIKKKIDMIADTIKSIEDDKDRFMRIFLGFKSKYTFPDEFRQKHGIMESRLFQKINLHGLGSIRIAAVDGSILRESMLGVDLIATKYRGVVFRFFNNKPPHVKYFPRAKNENLNLSMFIQDSSTLDIDFYMNAKRMLGELNLVHDILVQEPNIDLMIIDGSLCIPPLFLQPLIHRSHLKTCLEISDLLIRILDICERKNVLLVGVVKDSMKRTIVDILGNLISIEGVSNEFFKPFFDFNYRRVLATLKDYEFFFRFLKAGERSFIYKSSLSSGLTSKGTEFESYMENHNLGLFSYLIKPVPMDIPLRVDFIVQDEKNKVFRYARRTESLLYPVSKIMIDYSEPSPQFEAHRRVKIPEHEFKAIIEIIRRKTGYCSTLLQKRRDRRPF